MADLPSGTVTLLFTDIEGSTTRWEHQRETMQAALACHDAILRTAIEAHGVHVFKTVGDAFCAAFTSAPGAPFVELYREAANRAGHDPTQLPVSINSPAYLADTSRQASDEGLASFVLMMNRIGQERGWGPMSRVRYH